jgi:Vanillate O-demethylase oxygenase C-terminal domain
MILSTQQGSVEIGGSVDACMENMLDLLHISYVHSFGNMNNPVPYEVTYEHGYDDDTTQAIGSTAVTFRYRSGPKSFSSVIGRSAEVVVRNEFHLPYNAVIRVYFGESCIKTIHAAAVPSANGKTVLHWKLYRNFALTHPRDEGPLNAAMDWAFSQMMKVTLQEDKV